MKNFKLLIIAVVLVAIALVVSQDSKTGAGDPLVGRNLLSAAEIDQVRAFTLTAADEEISLAQQNGSWRVTSREGFAAQPDRIEDLFQKLSTTRIIEMVSANKERHADLGVASPASGTRPDADSLWLTLRDKDGKEIKTLLLGKGRQSRGPDGAMGFGEDGQYVRTGSDDKVYLVSNKLWIDKTPLRWLNTSLLKLPAADISRINSRPVVGADGYVLTRESATAALQLTDLPEGQQTKRASADAVARFFENIEVGDIIATATPLEHPDLASATLIEVETFKGLTVSMRIGSGPTDLANVGKGHIISLDAHYTGTDTALAALASETAGNAAKFVYAIPEARVKSLLVKPAELHEAKPAPPLETATGTATASAELQQVEATHILIAWQGADRSSATRSKEEARKLIDELHEKIKKGADIGELAKEHSDCPSGKSSNGSLGSFGRGMMAKPFEDAAFGLEVGKVSGVVETGFGYHLIRRDK
ncbi:MAG: DUF4340 domain-containing protein [Candidatus Riflebacteria bacterium]|nr:DUF4340 domain-containing protein [Candidatus Riflebacteria bacterium]